MAVCICSRTYYPTYSGNPDDCYCSYCKSIINRQYLYTDRNDFEHAEVTSRIVEQDRD